MGDPLLADLGPDHRLLRGGGSPRHRGDAAQDKARVLDPPPVLTAEERVERVLPVVGRARVATLQPEMEARAAKVPAPGPLPEVPPNGSHISELRRRGHR